MNKEIYNLLPQEVKNILFLSNGWLVGSSLENILNNNIVKDYDIIITDFKLFSKCISIYSKYFKNFTTFGGIKVEINDIIIDFWHSDLESFIRETTYIGIIYNMQNNIALNLK